MPQLTEEQIVASREFRLERGTSLIAGLVTIVAVVIFAAAAVPLLAKAMEPFLSANSLSPVAVLTSIAVVFVPVVAAILFAAVLLLAWRGAMWIRCLLSFVLAHLAVLMIVVGIKLAWPTMTFLLWTEDYLEFANIATALVSGGMAASFIRQLRAKSYLCEAGVHPSEIQPLSLRVFFEATTIAALLCTLMGTMQGSQSFIPLVASALAGWVAATIALISIQLLAADPKTRWKSRAISAVAWLLLSYGLAASVVIPQFGFSLSTAISLLLPAVAATAAITLSGELLLRQLRRLGWQMVRRP